jgi:glycosyltransferase involved in cell wall biosynthesis
VLVDEDGGFGPSHERVEVVGMEPPRPLSYPFEPLAEWGRIGEVRRLAREHEVDVVHATRLGYVPRRERLVITAWDPIVSPLGRFRAGAERGEPRAMEAMFGLADLLACRRAGAIVGTTPQVAEALRRFGRCEWIPPFLDDREVGPARSGRPNDVVMVAGALDLARKGLDLALEAFSQVRGALPDARLILVGGWIDSERPAALPEFCEARGRLDPSELRAVLRAAGCCLIPSRWEEFGYSGLEALAAGIPVACTPLPAYQGLSGGGVFVANAADPGQLAEQVVAALGSGDFGFPEECRASTALPKIVALYESLL